GSGMVRAIPGPVFSICAYTGGLVMRSRGPNMQLVGCIVGTVAIFLSSVLLLLFFFPVWGNLKKYAVIYRSLEGINAAIAGIMTGASFYLMKDISIDIMEGRTLNILNFAVIVLTLLLLLKSRLPSPIIVLGCILLGWVYYR